MDLLSKKAKTYLDEHRGERVTLERLASAVGASPFYLQRRFKEAFGVSPRDYQDAHRVEAVKSSLKNGSRVTDAVFDAGYGSVSRFYEKQRLGMSARDYRAGGRGQRITYCTFPSALGTVLVATTEKGVCSVKLGDGAKRLLIDEFRAAELREKELPELKKQILAFIEGQGTLTRLPLDIRGTVFQRRVWDALARFRAAETGTSPETPPAAGPPG